MSAYATCPSALWMILSWVKSILTLRWFVRIPSQFDSNRQQAIQTYYRMAGWDSERAVPTREKLHELDLSWAVGELDRRAMKK